MSLMEVLSYDQCTGIFSWRLANGRQPAGAIAGTLSHGYLCVRVGGRRYMAHRLAFLFMTGEMPDGDVDHINGNRTDNRWSNLRKATRSQNLANMKLRPQNSTGYKGVSFDKARGKFRAALRLNGATINLGRFTTAEEAHAAYMEAARKHFGEFARAA